MAEVGASIEHPLTGERITWLATAASSDGVVLAFNLVLKADSAAAMAHRHTRQSERFVPSEGLIGFELAGEQRTASAGEEVNIAAGVPHRWWNAGDDAARARVELRPALDTETFFETFFGLARDGRCNHKGMPGLLQISVLLNDLGDSAPRAAGLPLAVQDAFAALLAPVGHRAGLRAAYPRYSS